MLNVRKNKFFKAICKTSCNFGSSFPNKKTLLYCAVLSCLYYQSNVFSAPQQDILVSKNTKYSRSAFYIIFAQDNPVGTAQFSTSPSSSNFSDFSYESKLLQQLGESTVVTVVNTDGQVHNSNAQGANYSGTFEMTLKSFQETLSKEKNNWPESNGGSLKLLQNLIPISLLSKEFINSSLTPDRTKLLKMPNYNWEFSNSEIESKKTNLMPVFVKPLSSQSASDTQTSSFSPLTGMVLKDTVKSAKDSSTMQYDSNGILERGELPWFDGVILRFQKQNYDALENTQETILASPIDLSLFSGEKTFPTDVSILSEHAKNCLSFSEEAEKLVKKNAPQLPYLIHRKIFNLKTLCRRIDLLTEKIKSESSEKLLDGLGLVLRSSLAEEKKELPSELQNNSVEAVFTDTKQRWQWVRLASRLIQKIQIDLDAIINIELERKNTLFLKVHVEKLPPQAVVKALLKAKKSQIEATLLEGADSSMKLTSLVSFDNLPKKFEHINGLNFARQTLSQGKTSFTSLNSVCEAFGGSIGIDLGDIQGAMLNSYIAIGKWNDDSKIRALREFAKQTSASLSCKKMSFIVPKSLKEPAIRELAAFHKDILQTQAQFQLTNLQKRSLRLIPGEYELELFSVISGASLGKKRFLVPEEHQASSLSLSF